MRSFGFLLLNCQIENTIAQMENNINLNILLIEDNPGDAFLIKFYLEDSVLKFARLLHAEYLKTAVDLLQHNEFDVILLDLNLPDSKGIETLETVLKASQGSVVIVLTGLSDEELGLETVKKGAQDFLVKGQFDGKVLTSSVRYAFERYQLQKQVLQFMQQLNVAEAQFSAAQQLGDFGYWELDQQDKTMLFSSKLFATLGVKAPTEKQTLQAFLKSLPSEASKQFEAEVNKASNKPSSFTFEVNGVHFICKTKPNEQIDNSQQLTGIIIKA